MKDSYIVVATSLNATRSLTASPRLTLVHGDIRNQETVTKAVTPQSHTSKPSPHTVTTRCNCRRCEALL